MQRTFLLLIGFVFGTWIASAQSSAPMQQPLTLSDPLADKNFYLLTALGRDPELSHAISARRDINKLAQDRIHNLHDALAKYSNDANTYIAPLRWSPTQIEQISQDLEEIYSSDDSVRKFVNGPLRESGAGPAGLSGANLLISLWEQETAAINTILDVYGTGKDPRYPDIDRLAYDAHSVGYLEFLRELDTIVDDSTEDSQIIEFARPSIRASLLLLLANQRDEAARFEPLEQQANALPLARLHTFQWPGYTYSAILIPGIGPDVQGAQISPMGLLHTALAAECYRKKLSPFIILSGGYVHPNQTAYSEAVEMKKILINKFHIPAEAILIDPHARHTTTNLRNASRILYRDQFPLKMPVLIAGDIYQTRYILSAEFAQRCDKELGYRPFTDLKQIASDLIVWEPNYLPSLALDPRDPLDP
ncbi:MAG: YdcF family protein [Terracidiphilus sp.]|nr:YdcF family protein [Terracidiphilus sp.]